VIINTPQTRVRDFSKNPRANEEINAPQVRLIGADGKQIGVVSLREALEASEAAGLDLVEIAPSANPPVCKIIDYGKYRYELTKKDKDNRKKQHVVQVKKIRFSTNIDDHDFMVKVNAARRFLEEGNRVKATLMLIGRQMTRKERAEEVLHKMVADLSDIAKLEDGPKIEGNTYSMLLIRKK
jgi:translation initiation factor IF-3